MANKIETNYKKSVRRQKRVGYISFKTKLKIHICLTKEQYLFLQAKSENFRQSYSCVVGNLLDEDCKKIKAGQEIASSSEQKLELGDNVAYPNLRTLAINLGRTIGLNENNIENNVDELLKKLFKLFKGR